MRGWPARRRRPARGGPTGRAGWPSARGRWSMRPRSSARRWRMRRGPTSVSKEPLLMITGFALTSAVFEPVLDLYESRFECILYDPPAGLTTSMPELAADAARRLRRYESAHV